MGETRLGSLEVFPKQRKGSPVFSRQGQPSQTIAPIFRKPFLWEGRPPGRETTKPRPVGFIFTPVSPKPRQPAFLKFFHRSLPEFCRNPPAVQPSSLFS